MASYELDAHEAAAIDEMRAEARRWRVVRRTEQTARKQYACWRCGMYDIHTPATPRAVINPGERYVREWAYIDGELHEHAEHVVCPRDTETGS